jgi:predicted MFS family arabinose efflux permease
MLVPLAAHLAPEATRGRVIGTVVSGLLFGILLARPLASLVADQFGWRTVFLLSAVLMAALAFALVRMLPQHRPSVRLSYRAILTSLWSLLRTTPLLQRRAAYQAALFGAFSLFWTAVPLELAGPPFGFTQRGIALFTLAGASGALAAPVAGWLADKGLYGEIDVKVRIQRQRSSSLVRWEDGYQLIRGELAIGRAGHRAATLYPVGLLGPEP